MPLLDRHRVARLVELSALERVAQGAERLRGEEDVAYLIQAAYHDATEAARADFMARVGKLPTGEWPWTAVRSSAPRSAVVGASIGSVSVGPRPSAAPLLLVLLRGQAESADVDPGNRLPARGTPEAVTWEPLYRALDAWDTPTIVQWIGPQGWSNMATASAGSPAREGGAPAPAGDGKDLPAPQPAGEWTIPWTHPAMLAAGAVVVVAAGTVLYTLAQERSRRALEEALASQEAP